MMNTLRRGKPIGPSVPYSPATVLSVSASSGNSNPCLPENAVVAGDVLGRDAEHLRVELGELLELVVVAVELLRAHRRVVTRIEHEHDRVAGVVAERHVAVHRWPAG